MEKWKEALIIVAGGSLGGVISVMDAWSDPDSFPLTMAKFFALFVIPFVKGGIAAGIGVYVLTSTDTQNISKAFFFAIACGLAFPSILSKSGSLVDSVTSQVAVHTVNDNAEMLNELIAKGESTGKIDVAKVQAASEKIILAREKIHPETRTNADTTLRNAVTALAKRVEKGDEKAATSITDLSRLSSDTKSRAISSHAVKELESINPSAIPPRLRPRLNTTIEEIQRTR